MARSPNITRFGGGYEGKVGPGILGVGGNLIDVRGVGTESSLEGFYNVNDPLGFGGKLSAGGFYKNPTGGKRSVGGGFKYKVNL